MNLRVVALLLLAIAAPANAQLQYTLTPLPLGEGVYVFLGATEHFTRENGGDIVNTGFIDAPGGVIVIDTGPSKRYGEAQRAAIRATTGKDVVQVLITHAHPDHFLGNQAYAGIPIYALPGTVTAARNDGGKLAENLYRLLGGWMDGTVAKPPQSLPNTGRVEIAGRTLELIALQGHTDADLAVFDVASGTLFAGDLAFSERTPTTPHANLQRWHEAIAALRTHPHRQLVPGHGPAQPGDAALDQTAAYLDWLQATLAQAADNGLDMTEAMALPAPERFASLPVFAEEFVRSVVHLYPALEERSLPHTTPLPDDD